MSLYPIRILYESSRGLSYEQIENVTPTKEEVILKQEVHSFIDKTRLEGNTLPNRNFSQMNQLYIVDDVSVFKNISLKLGSCAHYLQTHRKLKKMQTFVKSKTIKMKSFCSREESFKQYLVVGLSKSSADLLKKQHHQEQKQQQMSSDDEEEHHSSKKIRHE